MNDFQLLKKVNCFIDYCFQKKAEFLSTQRSKEYTDGIFEIILPSWIQLQQNDLYIPKKIRKEKLITNLRDAKITDITQYYLNEDMEKEFAAIKMMKEDYQKLMNFGGLYNYVAMMVKNKMRLSPIWIDEAIGILLNGLFKIFKNWYNPMKGRFFPILTNEIKKGIIYTLKTRFMDNEDIRQWKKNKEFRQWEDEIYKKFKRPPNASELAEWKSQWEEKHQQAIKKDRTRRQLILTKFVDPVSQEGDEGSRDVMLENLFTKNVSPSYGINSVTFVDFKSKLLELVSNKGNLSEIQKFYLNKVLVEGILPKATDLAVQFGVTRQAIFNHLKALPIKIRKILQTTGEFDTLADIIRESQVKHAKIAENFTENFTENNIDEIVLQLIKDALRLK
jgi:hypothetical protein